MEKEMGDEENLISHLDITSPQYYPVVCLRFLSRFFLLPCGVCDFTLILGSSALGNLISKRPFSKVVEALSASAWNGSDRV